MSVIQQFPEAILHTKQLESNNQPLILLHGWGHDLRRLEPLAELLISQRSPHLIDLPGFGRSPRPGSTWSVFDYADRIVRYMDEQSLSQTDLLGHSFGGKISLALAIRYPDRVKKLILLAPSGLLPRLTFAPWMRSKVIKAIARGTKWVDGACSSDLFGSYFVPTFGSSDYKMAGPMQAILVRSVNEELSPLISSIKTTTLLLWGEKDLQTPIEMANRLHAMMSDSSLLTFPQHGHDLFAGAGAHLCAYHIRSFLDSSR